VSSLEEYLSLLEPLRQRPERTGIFSDFDGTLAEIVDDPAQARPLHGIPGVLHRLSRSYGRVGVISGRPVAFLRSVLGGDDLVLYGLYGLERARGSEAVLDPDVERWRPVVEETARRAEAAGVAPLVERKGASVSLHFRTDPARAEDVRRWSESEAARTDLVVLPARMAYELRPPVERDKGTALAEAAGGLEAVCFLGDDAGDLAAFDVLDTMAAAGIYTLRVAALGGPESPDELERRADHVVLGPQGARALLERLL
jgi:trehalose 6-phosphate phosphatase